MIGQIRFVYRTKTGDSIALLADVETTRPERGSSHCPPTPPSLYVLRLTLENASADLIPLIQGDTMEDIERAIVSKLSEPIY